MNHEPPVADDSDASDDDDEQMEVDGAVSAAAESNAPMEVDTVSKEVKRSRVAPVSSGLPQSKEELESLINLIHNTVNSSVLPRLHKCLNAKVSMCLHLCTAWIISNVYLQSNRKIMS